VIKLDISTLLTSQVTDCQIHVIGKAIRPLFADLVTICLLFKIVTLTLLWLYKYAGAVHQLSLFFSYVKYELFDY